VNGAPYGVDVPNGSFWKNNPVLVIDAGSVAHRLVTIFACPVTVIWMDPSQTDCLDR
jgi:hypothetical protein